MQVSDILAAKSNQKNGTWLSLSQHLIDTAGIMQYLLSNYVPPSVITASGLNQEHFCNLAVFIAAVHDIGKATAVFQGKICDSLNGFANWLSSNSIDVSTSEMGEYSPHALAGAAILNCRFEIDESICDIIASHHGIPRTSCKETKFHYQLEHYQNNYFNEESKEKYAEAWIEIFRYASELADVSEIKSLSVQAQMILSGLLIMADWIASNEQFFPLAEPFTLCTDQNRLINGLKALEIPPYKDFGTSYMDEDLFSTRFSFLPNEVQKGIMEIVNGEMEPGIMIIEAPMGLGKTEAALAAAEVMSSLVGSGGVFFGLPTRGTADGIFPRVKNWVSVVSRDEKVSISLSHSSAGFNKEFSDIKALTCDESGGISVNSWMLGRYRKLLPDFVIGTVDQALFSTLKKKFIMLLHLGLSGKTVIIDEVHSYDDYMSEYMYSMLSWLGAYKVPVVLLSATLTKEKRGRLIKAYTGKELTEDSDAYPAVTWSDGENVDSVNSFV